VHRIFFCFESVFLIDFLKNMGKAGCVIPGCKPDSGGSRFTFPNPSKNPLRFAPWKRILSFLLIWTRDNANRYRSVSHISLVVLKTRIKMSILCCSILCYLCSFPVILLNKLISIFSCYICDRKCSQCLLNYILTY